MKNRHARCRLSSSSIVTLVCCSFFLLSISCGGSRNAKKDQDIVGVPRTIEFTLNAPASYYMEDAECQHTPDDTLELTQTSINSWTSSGVNSPEVTLSEIKSGKSLKSNFVEETFFGLEYVQTCDFSTSWGKRCLKESGEPESWNNSNAKGGYLKICKGNYTYGRTSYEGVGLTSIYFLEQAFQRYQSFSEAPVPLKPVRLLILPDFKTEQLNFPDPKDDQKKKRIIYITHNAGYFPETVNGNIISIFAIFPEAACLVKKATGFLWESSFVWAHEFAHHLEKSITPNYFNIYGELANHFPPELQNVNEKDDVSSKTRLALLSNAISESFADLIGYYSDDATGASLSQIEGFGYNRTITYGEFKNKTEKILTETVVEQFLSAGSLSQTSSVFLAGEDHSDDQCSFPKEEPNFSDPHIIGAILAYGLDGVFSLLSAFRQDTGDAPSFNQQDIGDRYRLSIAWIKAVRENWDVTKDSESTGEYFQVVSDALELVSTAYLGVNENSSDEKLKNLDHLNQVKSKICRHILKMWPVIRKPPFSEKDGRCPTQTF